MSPFYRRVQICFDLDPLENTKDLFILREPIVRNFHWIKQMSSGGSHVTIFSVRISTLSKEKQIRIADCTSKDQSKDIAEVLLLAFRDGVENFIKIDNERIFPFHGLCLDLLDFVDHPVDLKQVKYSQAIRLILLDLLSELRTGRLIPSKRIDGPI
ncbi:hypothetical protein [Leptospira adleri]|nr:hypothetical protein [Leptospira adleri]